MNTTTSISRIMVFAMVMAMMMTAALVAAGWLAGGRESAPGDPFRLPKPLRSVALRRFGLDFDDAACYPRVLLSVVAIHRQLPAMLLRSEAALVPRHHGAPLRRAPSHPCRQQRAPARPSRH